MDPSVIGLLGIVALLLVMIVLRMPVGFAMALVGYVGIALVLNPSAALSSVANSTWSTLSSYGLTVIPFFILMGNICFASGVSNRLYRTANTWAGQLHGGIAMATVLTCAGFAAICGSNAATAATMSSVALPEMRKLGYSPAMSTGSVACGATLGVVIPPSVVLIVIGLATGESISKLFIASFVPGVVLTLLLMASVYGICRVYPELGPRGPKTSFKDKLKSLPGSIEMLVLFALIMLGMYMGWFTPTEAGAAGAFFAIVIALVGRHLSRKAFMQAVHDTLRVSCMVIVIVTGAVIFGKFLAVTRLPFVAADWVSGLPVPPVVILLLMLAIYAIGGAFMDALGLLMITIPIFFPVATRLGYDPVWFAVIVTIITAMGAITPPVGINTYVVAANAPGISLGTVFVGVSYFLAAYALCVAALILFPELATALPALMH
jgi:tripartite ATP-independent transporter DctM subunit